MCLFRSFSAPKNPYGIPGGSPYQVFELDDLQKAVQDLEAIFDLTRRFLHEYSIQVE